MSAVAFTVTEVTTLVGNALAARPELEDVLVEGEISNLTRPASGHIYFTLKDRSSALGCVCFRTNALRLAFAPENGMTVLAHGQVSVYAQQGRYQLVADRLEPSGIGALALAVEQRKRALAAEGLFDQRLKRCLPLLPARVAVVTSRTGAALHDVITVLGRRAPCVDVVFSSATVQGDGAAETIVSALRRAGRARGVEVVLLVRGGGSLEDLMAFNDEAVARAIRACPVPVVSGVGHETDVTIADLAADHRAATPSAAAETVAPSCGQLRGELGARDHRLRTALRREVTHKRARAQRRFSRLGQLSPGGRVARMRQDLSACDVRLRGALIAGVSRRQRDLERARGALELHSPFRALPIHRERLAARTARLEGGIKSAVSSRRRRLEGADGRLEALSPLRVIDRGYSITVDAATGRVVTTAAAVAPGAVLRTRLAQGSLVSEVLPGGVEVAADRERMYDGESAQRHTNEDDDG
ncbi:MAG: exodeoxyribonuclease VII large subunit [Candidatus Dormibacteraeota bacterium]|uniref:Exodeoxyribonuclease 7 large subunit n=1 Tax=Candidatus Aeolococcus gillhamiae TaxID=3127015 RepID=A0A2W6A3B3_9BACT|nr:exodeoxyribonuclease VII large subunit [Candidatus Dormibacteraeota bacterium]PZR78124.1 MAG: exodeoxyribonuclease VII large subunit [Candidatus Dormibacter sp. RRmetagenome_bin12]